MKVKFRLAISVLILFLASPGSTAVHTSEIQSWMQFSQTSAQTTRSYIEIMQMGGTPAQLQQARAIMQVHQKVYNGLSYLLQNPQLLQDPAVEAELRSNMLEYQYRVSKDDWRPKEQIAGQIQQWAAYRRWQVSTPAGQASWQNEQNQKAQAFSNHQAQMQSNQQNFDNYMYNVRRRGYNQDLYHKQYVNGIHDQTQYVDPNTGKNYLLPNSYTTNMIPYEQYYYQD